MCTFEVVIIWVCDIFLSPSGGPVNSIFQWQYVFVRSTFLMKHFSSYYQNAYGHQTLQVGHMLRGAVTHKYERHLNGVVLLGHVTNKIHSELADDVLTPHKARCWLSASGSQTWMTLWSSDQCEVCLKNLYFPFLQRL